MSTLERCVLLVALILLQAVSCAHQSFGYELLQPHKVILEGQKYDNLRDPYIPQYQWVYGSSLGLDLDLFSTTNRKTKYSLFFNPTLKFRANEQQIRQGGLVYEGGLGIQNKTSIYFVRQHESLHCLECNADETSRNYPVMDAWALRIEWNVK